MNIFKHIRNWFKLKFKLTVYEVKDVFTILQADVNYVKRDKIDDLLRQEFLTPGKQLIVFGHSGGGKTTSVFKMLKENNVKYIKTHCETYTTFEQLIINAFAELDKYVVTEKTTSKSVSSKGDLSCEYLNIKSSIGRESNEGEGSSYAPIVPPQLTPQKLAEFMGEGNIVWIIEDFHKVLDKEKIRIADVIKIFVDNSNQYPQSKIICIGACESAHELISLNPDLRDRVSEIKVPLLTNEEIRQIVTNGFALLNISSTSELIDDLVEYSDRIGSAAHQMCLDICNKNSIVKTMVDPFPLGQEQMEHAINGFIFRHQDTFKTIYEKATEDPLGWYVLKTISSNSHSKLPIQEINRIISNSKNYSFSEEEIFCKIEELTLPPYSILYKSSSNKYGFSSPFWHRFIKLQLTVEQREKHEKNRKRNRGKGNFANQQWILPKNSDVIEKILYLHLQKFNEKDALDENRE